MTQFKPQTQDAWEKRFYKQINRTLHQINAIIFQNTVVLLHLSFFSLETVCKASKSKGKIHAFSISPALKLQKRINELVGRPLWLLVNANELRIWIPSFVPLPELYVHFVGETAFLHCRHFFHGFAPSLNGRVLGQVNINL